MLCSLKLQIKENNSNFPNWRCFEHLCQSDKSQLLCPFHLGIDIHISMRSIRDDRNMKNKFVNHEAIFSIHLYLFYDSQIISNNLQIYTKGKWGLQHRDPTRISYSEKNKKHINWGNQDCRNGKHKNNTDEYQNKDEKNWKNKTLNCWER